MRPTQAILVPALLRLQAPAGYVAESARACGYYAPSRDSTAALMFWLCKTGCTYNLGCASM